MRTSSVTAMLLLTLLVLLNTFVTAIPASIVSAAVSASEDIHGTDVSSALKTRDVADGSVEIVLEDGLDPFWACEPVTQDKYSNRCTVAYQEHTAQGGHGSVVIYDDQCNLMGERYASRVDLSYRVGPKNDWHGADVASDLKYGLLLFIPNDITLWDGALDNKNNAKYTTWKIAVGYGGYARNPFGIYRSTPKDFHMHYSTIRSAPSKIGGDGHQWNLMRAPFDCGS